MDYLSILFLHLKSNFSLLDFYPLHLQYFIKILTLRIPSLTLTEPFLHYIPWLISLISQGIEHVAEIWVGPELLTEYCYFIQ